MAFPTTEVTVEVTEVDQTISLNVLAPQGGQGPQGDPGIGLPAGGLTGQVATKASNADYNIVWATGGGGGGSAIWGGIIGTLSNQTDLQNALNAKQNFLNPSVGGAAFISDSDISYASDVLSNTATIGWSIGNGSMKLQNGFGYVEIKQTANPSLAWVDSFGGASGTLQWNYMPSDLTWLTPTASGTLALTVSAIDLEITDTTKGVILRSPGGTRYRLQVADDGTLSTTPA